MGSDLFSTVEQALWSVLFLAVAVAFAFTLCAWPGHPRSYRLLVALLVLMGVEQGYESLCLYLPRYLDEQRAGTPLEPFGVGLARLARRGKVTKDMAAWADDAPWMSAYFSPASGRPCGL